MYMHTHIKWLNVMVCIFVSRLILKSPSVIPDYPEGNLIHKMLTVSIETLKCQ